MHRRANDCTLGFKECDSYKRITLNVTLYHL